MKSKKIKIFSLISFIALMICILLTTIFSFAIFTTSATDEASIKTGTVDVKIIEEEYSGSLNDEGKTDNKVFTIKSNGSKSTYARVKIVPSLEYYNSNSNNWETCGFISSQDINYNIAAPSWAESQGYYYNKKIMNTNDISDTFSIENVSVNKTILEKEPSTSFRVVFSITAEGCQASNNNYKLTWGSDCILPDGIEEFKNSDMKIY